MKSLLKIGLLLTMSVSLCFCSSSPKQGEASEEDYPRYENYHSSGVYQDIKGEGRSVSSQDYSDDDYGDLDEEQITDRAHDEEEIVLGDTDQAEEQNDPIPVEKVKNVVKKAQKKKKVSAKFKNGMYRLAVNCTMRAEPTTKAKAAGKAKKGKKLWMEGHNKDWVKVFKKSGPVYINKLCL